MPPAKVRRVPPATLHLVLHAVAERGWERVDHGDEDQLEFARGLQTLRLTRSGLCSATFTLRKLGAELDLLDRNRA